MNPRAYLASGGAARHDGLRGLDADGPMFLSTIGKHGTADQQSEGASHCKPYYNSARCRTPATHHTATTSQALQVTTLTRMPCHAFTRHTAFVRHALSATHHTTTTSRAERRCRSGAYKLCSALRGTTAAARVACGRRSRHETDMQSW